ncbi:hypothetical protein AC1031_015978 [Aphanomyces cochlioides]|nr:hypothetical protein AC1031_015978 [Aphanomyces cochlioides]
MKTSVALVAAAVVAIASGAETSLDKCGKSVTSVLTAGTATDAAKTCFKDSGIDPKSTSISEADMAKAAGTASCKTWWDGLVKDIQKIKPQCEFPNFDGSGALVDTAKFNMPYDQFLKLSQKLVSSGAKHADPAPADKCGATVSDILTKATTNDGAKACSKETGIALDSTTVSKAVMAKARKSKTCRKWWDNIVKEIKATKPKCDFTNIDGSGKKINTAKFNMRYSQFLKLSAKTAQAQGKSKSIKGRSAPKKDGATPTTTAASSSSTSSTPAPTTTEKSSAVVTALSLSAVVVAALFA